MQKLTIKLSPFQTVEISAETSQDVIRAAAFWQSIPIECPECKSPLVFDYQTPKTFKYYKLKCTGPTAHTTNLSERSDQSGMYYDNRKAWQVWRAGVTEADALESAAADAMADPTNAPGSERGKLIARVLELAAERVAEGKTVNLKLDDLGSRQTPGLEAMVSYLEKL